MALGIGILRPSLKGVGIWPEIRIALKRDDRIAGRTVPPNFKCSLVIWSGPSSVGGSE